MYNILAFTGRSGSGKDYLAKYLIEHHNYVRVSFSDELKRIASEIFPWLDPDYEPEDKEVIIDHPLNHYKLSPRATWQSMDFLREIDPRVFVYGVQNKIIKLLNEGKKVLITDIRKPVEHEYLMSVQESGVAVKFIKVYSPYQNEYEDENVIDAFCFDYIFKNMKTGYSQWIKFLIDNDIIEPDLMNVIPDITERQYVMDETFRQHAGEPEPHQRSIAVASEYGEFLKEINSMWCWWKPESTFSDKAKEEFVDLFMFSLSCHLMRFGDDLELTTNDLIADCTCIGNVGSDVDKKYLFNELHKCVVNIMNDDHYGLTIISLLKFGLHILDMNITEFMKLHKDKINLNMKRIQSGYCETGDKTNLESVIDLAWHPQEIK